MSFLAYFESKKNIVFNLRFSVILRICQSSVGRQSCHSLYIGYKSTKGFENTSRASTEVSSSGGPGDAFEEEGS
jgi:hypothetical protein